MIITYDYDDDNLLNQGYKGAMHKYPNGIGYSGRPQMVHRNSNSPVRDILCRVDSLCLINTSFNTHGNPILFTLDECIADFKKQIKQDKKEINWLIVYDDKD
jgi:predicted NodU family carbamoyl transferase